MSIGKKHFERRILRNHEKARGRLMMTLLVLPNAHKSKGDENLPFYPQSAA